jgi:hypothetical protein
MIFVFFRGRLIPSAVFLMLCISCSILTGSIKTARESENNVEAMLKANGIYINSISVKKSFDSEAVRENAQYAFEILIGMRGAEKGEYKTDAVLKEESILRGFEQLNTVSLELIIRDHENMPLKMILVSEDTENTLSSYRYLYKILKKGIKETGL